MTNNDNDIDQTSSDALSHGYDDVDLTGTAMKKPHNKDILLPESTNQADDNVINEHINEMKKTHQTLANFSVGQATECGEYHDKNEDYVGYVDGFYAVADGVGGGAFGDIASQVMVEYCQAHSSVTSSDEIVKTLKQAEIQVTEAISSRGDKKGGCAFAGVWINEQTGHFCYSWVGDVRIYKLSPATNISATNDGNKSDNHEITQSQQTARLILKPLTEDQTFDSLGEISPSGKQDNLARLVGFDTMQTPVVKTGQLADGEYLLLISDGIHHFLSYSQLQKYAQKLLNNGDLNTFCQQLVIKAKEHRSYDDCTALVCHPNISNNAEIAENKDKQALSEKSRHARHQRSHSDVFFDIQEHSAHTQSTTATKESEADDKRVYIQSHINMSKLGILCLALLCGIIGGGIGSLLINHSSITTYIALTIDSMIRYFQ